MQSMNLVFGQDDQPPTQAANYNPMIWASDQESKFLKRLTNHILYNLSLPLNWTNTFESFAETRRKFLFEKLLADIGYTEFEVKKQQELDKITQEFNPRFPVFALLFALAFSQVAKISESNYAYLPVVVLIAYTIISCMEQQTKLSNTDFLWERRSNRAQAVIKKLEELMPVLKEENTQQADEEEHIQALTIGQ